MRSPAPSGSARPSLLKTPSGGRPRPRAGARRTAPYEDPAREARVAPAGRSQRSRAPDPPRLAGRPPDDRNGADNVPEARAWEAREKPDMGADPVEGDHRMRIS